MVRSYPRVSVGDDRGAVHEYRGSGIPFSKVSPPFRPEDPSSKPPATSGLPLGLCRPQGFDPVDSTPKERKRTESGTEPLRPPSVKRHPKGEGDDKESASLWRRGEKQSDGESLIEPLWGIHPTANVLATSNGWVKSSRPRITTQSTSSNVSIIPEVQSSSSGGSHSAGVSQTVSGLPRTPEDTTIQGATVNDLSEPVSAIPKSAERRANRPSSRPSTISNASRFTCEPEQIPLVIQMIRSGQDADIIVRSVLGDDAQISINAIDEVCSPSARRHKTRELKLISTRSVD